MIDFDAHRKILAWAFETQRLCKREFDWLMFNLREAEWSGSECAGKSKFREFTFANKIASRASGRRDIGFAPYRCHHCGYWHIGTKRPKEGHVGKG